MKPLILLEQLPQMAFQWVKQELASQEAKGLRRELAVRTTKSQINFASNDYLALSKNSHVIDEAAKALAQFGAGAGAARLISGTLPCHLELEAQIARWLGTPAALVFGAGYLANLGVVSSIVGRSDKIFADRLVHASLVDGIRLSGAEMLRFEHNNSAQLETLLKQAETQRKVGQRFLIVSESVFSMDGDIAPIGELITLAARYGAGLLIDEAHALGVFGKNGEGVLTAKQRNLETVIVTGTLSKALGSYGGLVACTAELREYFINFARPFMFNTALPPASAVAASAALKIISEQDGLGAELLARAAAFRTQLNSAGLNTLGSQSHIVPVLIGDAQKTVAFGQTLNQRGILVAAVRPPTVPPGTSRLRFSITLEHSPAELQEVADAVIKLARESGVIK